MPALPLDDAGPYVAGAYLVFLGLVLLYVAIMAAKLGRVQREVGELAELLDRRDAARGGDINGEAATSGAGGAGGARAGVASDAEHADAAREVQHR